LRNFTNDADTEARAWERLATNDFLWQTKLAAHGTDFVFKQQAQRFNQFEFNIIRQATNIVVGLDVRSAITAAGFNHVRVQSTLDQEIHGGSFWRFFQSLCHSAFKGPNKLRTNGLTLGLWVGDTGKLRQESLSLMRGDQLRASRRHEVLFNLLTLDSAQQAVVDEYTGQPVADSALHQSCSNRGVDAAGETTNGSAVGADLGADIIDKLLRNICRSPGLL